MEKITLNTRAALEILRKIRRGAKREATAAYHRLEGPTKLFKKALQGVFPALAELALFSSSLRSSHIPPIHITNNLLLVFSPLSALASLAFTVTLSLGSALLVTQTTPIPTSPLPTVSLVTPL